jgi:hypothetical protein
MTHLVTQAGCIRNNVSQPSIHVALSLIQLREVHKVKYRYGVLLGSCLALQACVTYEPVVSDYNGDSVKLQVPEYALQLDETLSAKTQAEATRICQAGGSKRAEYASTRTLPSSREELLFLCLS